MKKFHDLKILKSQSLRAEFLLRHNALMPVHQSLLLLLLLLPSRVSRVRLCETP